MSIVETIINEFCGIPGLKLSLINPNLFELEDSTLPDNHIFKKVAIRIADHGNSVNLGLLTWAPSTLRDKTLHEDYVENTLLIAYIECIIMAHISSLNNCNVSVDLDKYRPSPAIINAAIKLDLLEIGKDRYLETTYTLKSIRKDTNTFTGRLLANDYIHKIQKYDELETEYELIKKQYSEMNSDYAEKTIKSGLFEKIMTKLSTEDVATLDLTSDEYEIISKYATKSKEIQLELNLYVPPQPVVKPNPMNDFITYIEKEIEK